MFLLRPFIAPFFKLLILLSFFSKNRSKNEQRAQRAQRAQKSIFKHLYICVKIYININILIHKITYILKHCALFRVRVNDTNGLSMGRNVFIAPFIAPFFKTLRPFFKHCATR